MSKTYRLYQVDAFTSQKFTGNPAGVVTNADGLTPEQMQRIARELNNSETAFLFSPQDTDCDLHIRFFTPKAEVPICGHATVSAHCVTALERGLTGHARVRQRTGAGVLPVDVYPEGEGYRVVMTQGAIDIRPPLPEQVQLQIMQALGLPMEQLRPDLPMAIASTGHGKVMVGIRDLERLHSLRPDYEQLSRISAATGCNGYYVFTLHPGQDPLVHGRMFAPISGVPEDPVTGNANGPLGAYLVHTGLAGAGQETFSFRAAQGEAMGRAGTIGVEVDIRAGRPVQARISGTAVVVFQTELTL